MSTSGLSTGSHGREGPGKGEGRLRHPQPVCCTHLPHAASRPKLEPLAPGDTGLIQGPLPPASHPWSVQKTPCFLHTVDASALAQLALNPTPCAVGHAAHQGLPCPQHRSLLSQVDKLAKVPQLASLTLTQGLTASPAKASLSAGVLPALDPGQSRDGAGSRTPSLSPSSLGERRRTSWNCK